jgi:hypothetical protein
MSEALSQHLENLLYFGKHTTMTATAGIRMSLFCFTQAGNGGLT